MSGFDSFLGNGQLISRLKRDIASGRLAHAYIIEGAKGCGKRTLAKLICQAVSCRDANAPCMKCTSCDKIERWQSPDVIPVVPEEDKVQLGVDVIRRVREEAVFAPIDLPKKFYVITEADAMNSQAQNALLKILEEPPPHVMFLLLSENADLLLSTVRSRAPILRLEALPDGIIKSKLSEMSHRQKDVEPEALTAIIKLSRGSLGAAIELLSSEDLSDSVEIYQKAHRYIELLASRKDAVGELSFYEHAFKATGAKERVDFEAMLLLISDGIRDLINVKLTKNPTPIFFTSSDKARTLASEFTIGRLMSLSEVFDQAKKRSERNANLNLIKTQSAAAALCSALRQGK